MSDSPGGAFITITIRTKGEQEAIAHLGRIQSANRQVAQSVNEVRASLLASAEAAKAVPIGIEQGNAAQERFLHNLEELRTETKALNAEGVNAFGELRESIAAADKQAGGLNERLAQAKKIQSTAGGFDDQRTGMFAGESGGGSGSGGDLSPSARKEALRLALNNARYAASDLSRGQIFPALVNAQQSAAGLSALGVSISSITTVAAPFLAAVAPIAPLLLVTGAAFLKVTADIDKGKSDLDNAIGSLDAYYEAIVDGTTESINKEISERQRRLDSEKEYAAQLSNEIDNILKAPVDLVTPGAAEAQAVAASVLAERYDKLTAKFKGEETNIDGLNRALGSSQVAANDAAAALEKHNKEMERQSQLIVTQVTEAASNQLRVNKEIAALQGLSSDQLAKKLDATKNDIELQEQYIQTLESTGEPSASLDAQINSAYLELQVMTSTLKYLEGGAIQAASANEVYQKSLEDAIKAGDEFADNTTKLASLETERAAIIEKRARDDSRASQVSALEAKIGAAKEVEAEQERGVRIVSLRRDAGNKEASAVQSNEAAKRKVNEAFMRDSLKALKDYQLAESRATQEYSLGRVRKLEDLYDELIDIAASGDVSAFIKSQRRGLKDVRRGDQDFGIAAQQRAEDFDGQRVAAQQARDQQLADLKQGLAQQRAEIRANLAQQIQQEQEAGKAKLTQSALLEQQLAALKDQFAAEDQARTRREEDAQIAGQIAAIKRKNDEIRPLITKAIDPFVSGVKSFASGVGDSVVGMISRIRSAATGATTPRPRHTGTLALANAEGGIYTKPTVGLLAEKPGYADAVIGYKQSEGFVPALMRYLSQAGAGLQHVGGAGGTTIYLTQNINAGDLVDKAALEELKRDVVGGIGDAKVILTGSNA